MNEAEFVDFVGNLIASIYQMGLTNAEVTAALVNERRETLAAAKRERDEARTALGRVIQERDAALLAASECAPSGEPSEEAINKSFEFLNMRLCEFGDKAEMRNLLRAAYAIDAMRPASDGWSKAARDVLAERQRQAEVEGYTPEHDREHRRGGGPMNDAEKIAPDYSRHEPSDAAWSAACVAYATTVGRAKLAEAIRAAYEVDDVRPAALIAGHEDAAVPQSDGWQPISTYRPEIGPIICLVAYEDGHVTQAEYSEYIEGGPDDRQSWEAAVAPTYSTGAYDFDAWPTYWRPLPPAPETKK